MKVLVLHSELGVLRGGGESFTRNLFTAFAGRGHRVAAAFVAGPHGRYPLPLPPSIEPIPLCGLWSRNLGRVTLSPICRCVHSKSRFQIPCQKLVSAIDQRAIKLHNLRFRKRVARYFAHRWGHFDAVYVHGDTLLAGSAAAHCPTVLRLPGPVSPQLASVLRSVPAVCANGHALARIRLFLDDHAIELPIGLDTQTFSPESGSVRGLLGWTERYRVVGYVGRLTHLKGVDLLAAAFRELSATAHDARLLIVGSGEAQASIRSLLAKEIARKVAHLQPGIAHEQLPRWYRAMDLLVMPTRYYENFSNAVVEAMACGVPVLASDVGGNRLLAKQGAGWLFTPGSVTSLAESLAKIIGNATETRSRGDAASRYVRRRYSWSVTAERLEWIMATRLGVTGR